MAHQMTKTVQSIAVPSIGSTVIVEAQTHALLHSMYDLKAIQINVQCSLIHDFIHYEFKLDHNAAETIKKHLQNSDQMVQEILFKLKEPQQSSREI